MRPEPHHQPSSFRAHEPPSSPVLEFGQPALKAVRSFMAMAIFCHRVSPGYGWGELAKPFLFEHLFKQNLWRVQQQRLPGVGVSCCSELCSAWCGLLLATSPRAQAACRGLPGSKNLSLLKLNWLKIPLLYPLFVFLSHSGVFHVDHKFLHPFFFSPSKCVHGWCSHLSKYLLEALSPPLLLWAFWMSCIEEYFAEVYFSWQ